MKIHHPNDLEFDPHTLRALARGDLDPVRQAVEGHHREKSPTLAKASTRPPVSETKANLPVGLSRSVGKSANGKPNRSEEDSAEPRHRAEQQAVGPSVKSPEERQQEYQELIRKRKQLTAVIRECEALEVMNHQVLAAKHYPKDAALAAARRRRDLWLMCCLFCSGMVIVGWVGFLSAWVAGSAFGMLVLLLAMMLKPLRALVYHLPSHADLRAERKSMEFRALNHIKMLEGERGLAWQCQRMHGYRSALGDKRFQRLVVLSKQGNLIKAMRTVAGIRLYLSYLLEARQAFLVVKHEYMKISALLQREYADLAIDYSW